MPIIRDNKGLLTALTERWHLETCSFHFLTGEATVTLEDVHKILKLSIHGERVRYDPVQGYQAIKEHYEYDGVRELNVEGYEL